MKSIPIELGGETRQLRYDLNALSAVEEQLGIAIAELTEQVASIRVIRTLLWAGLLHDNPAITQTEVGAWVDGDNMMDVMKGVTEALTSAFGRNPTTAAMPPPAVGVGKKSSGSGMVQ